MVRSPSDQIIVLQIRKIVEKGFGHLFITSSSSHFYYETDFEQYLFKSEATDGAIPTAVANFAMQC